MKISEIIAEGREGKHPENAKDSHTGEWRFRDVGGYDRTYNLNRVMMAAAMADGSSKKPVDMDQASFVEKFNLARPYSEPEHNMMQQAFATVDSDYKHTGPVHKSKETSDTHIHSPMSDRGPVKLKKRRAK
jgi:hypothetical protein